MILSYMKTKRILLYIILIILLLTLTILLLIKDNKQLIIISRDYSYSIYHSDNYETIDIEILTNNPDNYYFSKEFISSSRLYNNETELSLSVLEVNTSTYPVILNNEEFYSIFFKVKLPFTSTNLYVEVEHAFFEVNYTNDEQITIEIGDVSYLFHASDTSITLSNLSATHEMVDGYNTIGGINLELAGSSNHNVVITDIELLSNHVFVSKENIKENTTCEYDETVTNCIGKETYDFHKEFYDKELNIFLGKNNNVELYLPLLYEEMDFIYEAAIKVTYSIDHQEEVLIIDNFPYMKTSIFSTMKEGDYHIYTYPASH